MELNLPEHGAQHHPAAAIDSLPALDAIIAGLPADHPGLRLAGTARLADLLAPCTPIGCIAAAHLGPAVRPVRAILFDKSPTINWALGWHQDRTIAVQRREDVPGFGPWSVKAGIIHVEPPFTLPERMVTLRIHLDDVPADNAPLLVAPGSHRLGRIAEPEIAAIVERCGAATCLAVRGDIWAYATPVLHASATATGHAHRRVLQVDYAVDPLAPPLAWLGV